jgi:hypothetical protein
MRIPLLALTVSLALVPAARAADAPRTETHTSSSPAGEVRAELSYVKKSEFEYSDVRLKITRAGQVLLDAAVPAPCRECPTIPAAANADEDSAQLVDLDKNGEPEVVVDLYTGGAHCCLFSQIYGFDAAGNVYRRWKQDWGDVGYTLKDLDGDGSPEFRSADWRFSSAFTAYVLTGFPIQVWKYGGLKMNDVTRGYRNLIKASLRSHLKLYKQIRRDKDLPDVRGFLAAYTAEKYLLGQGDTALDLVYAAYRRGELRAQPGGDDEARGKRYITALRKFLRQTGYR